MDTESPLRVAREIVAKVPACRATTGDANGEANARVVNVKPLSDAWTVRFATDLRSRKPPGARYLGLASAHDISAISGD